MEPRNVRLLAGKDDNDLLAASLAAEKTPSLPFGRSQHLALRKQRDLVVLDNIASENPKTKTMCSLHSCVAQACIKESKTNRDPIILHRGLLCVSTRAARLVHLRRSRI